MIPFFGTVLGSACVFLINKSMSDRLQRSLSRGCNYIHAAEGRGNEKNKAFLNGAAFGIVEPIGALFTVAAASFVVPALPYLLSFAAGAMIYVVVEELIPERSAGKHFNIGKCFLL